MLSKKPSEDLSHNALNLSYIKTLRFFLMSVGAWADEPYGLKSPFFGQFQRKTFVVQNSIVVLGGIYYYVKNYATITFLLSGHLFITTSISILMMVRSFLTNRKEYDHIIKDFLTLHLVNHKHKGGHYKSIFDTTDKLSFYFTLLQTSLLILGPLLFNLTPMYADWKLGVFERPQPENITLDFAVFFEYPGFRQADHFYLTTGMNFYFSYNCGVLICYYDLLLCLMVFQIIAHINTLSMDLDTFKRPNPKNFGAPPMAGMNEEMELYDDEENKEVHVTLMEIIDHHRLIVSFAERLTDFFGPMLALNYLYHLVSCCILLLECTGDDPKALARFGPLTTIIFGQLIQLSVIFEIVNFKSEKLMNYVYYVPWESMDIRNRRTVCFLLHRVQTPITLTAMGIVPVGVQTMQGIIKTTLSYYAILQSLNN